MLEWVSMKMLLDGIHFVPELTGIGQYTGDLSALPSYHAMLPQYKGTTRAIQKVCAGKLSTTKLC